MDKILPWESLNKEEKIDFILENINEENINDLSDRFYRGEFNSEINITESIEEIENIMITNIKNLPMDALNLIGIQADYEDLINLCKTNTNLNNLCSNSNFWKNYISQNANIPMKLLIPFKEDIESLKKLAKEVSFKEIDMSAKYNIILSVLRETGYSLDILNEIYFNEKIDEYEKKDYLELYMIKFGGNKLGNYILDNYGCEEFFGPRDKYKILMLI